MALSEELESQGEWLFRHRSHLPLLLLLILVPSLWSAADLHFPFGQIGASIYRGLCVAAAFAGLWMRCLTVGFVPGSTSGRNTHGQVADSLNTNCVYSVVRHPLYFGNTLTYVAICAYPGVWWAGLFPALILAFYYERIMFREEALLRSKFGQAYLDWAEKTPAFFPRFGQWRSGDLSFCPRTVLRREYSGFFAIIVLFTLLRHGMDAIAAGAFGLDPVWTAALLAGLVIYLSLRTLKHRTLLLHVEGR